jgi:subtilase family serine protease
MDEAVDTCLFSLDYAPNLTMTLNSTKTFANYTYTGITNGYHNLTVSCNDSFNNWDYATVSNFRVYLLDLIISNVSLPFYSNQTLVTINVSNLGPPPASGVNVSCYLDNVIFDSKLISSMLGNTSYITNCTTTLTAGNNKVLNVTVDIGNSITERNETNNYYLVAMNVTQIANITLNTLSSANTTDTINLNGLIVGNDGTAMPNQKFTVKLNNVVVSSNTLNQSDFSSGTLSGVNITNGTVQLNLSSEGNLIN